LRNQLLRAASSVKLNLGEGYGRIQKGDQRRFFEIALGNSFTRDEPKLAGQRAMEPLTETEDRSRFKNGQL
jgi:hypothetical protein